jgi:uncharacterized protein
MRSTLLPHALDREFPQLAAKIAALKQTDAHFAHLLAQHDALDDQITKSEMGVTALDDVNSENLKKQRLRLKDELYRLANAPHI